MQYRLEFVKISNEHLFAGVGFAGNIFIVLNALYNLSDSDQLYVDMTNECACTEIGLNKNCWENYFNQHFLKEHVYLNSLIPANINYDDRESFMDPFKYEFLKNRFYNNFSIKDELKNDFNFFKNDKITLGVQVRLTDMKHFHNVSDFSKYVLRVKEIVKEHSDIEQIFLATDDSTIIESFKKEFDIPVLFHENMFRADEKNNHNQPYDRVFSNRTLHRYNMGKECLMEIFALNKCKYLLKADVSSISIVSILLSENIQKIFKL